jgi:hypothetical protein
MNGNYHKGHFEGFRNNRKCSPFAFTKNINHTLEK